MPFNHLVDVKQTYLEHFQDAFQLFRKSLRASVYFLIHSIWPDWFQQTGSNEIFEIHALIVNKYKKRS